MALGLTQPLTEMSSRNLPGGSKGRPVCKANNSSPFLSRLSRKCGSLEKQEALDQIYFKKLLNSAIYVFREFIWRVELLPLTFKNWTGIFIILHSGLGRYYPTSIKIINLVYVKICRLCLKRTYTHCKKREVQMKWNVMMFMKCKHESELPSIFRVDYSILKMEADYSSDIYNQNCGHHVQTSTAQHLSAVRRNYMNWQPLPWPPSVLKTLQPTSVALCYTHRVGPRRCSNRVCMWQWRGVAIIRTIVTSYGTGA
jgi:hypothetical protein